MIPTLFPLPDGRPARVVAVQLKDTDVETLMEIGEEPASIEASGH